MIDRFVYLKPALALVLIFIGGKIFVADLLGWEKVYCLDLAHRHRCLIGGGLLYSFWRTQRELVMP